jgi:hypothetical protein
VLFVGVDQYDPFVFEIDLSAFSCTPRDDVRHVLSSLEVLESVGLMRIESHRKTSKEIVGMKKGRSKIGIHAKTLFPHEEHEEFNGGIQCE